jgi:hypothetical protein
MQDTRHASVTNVHRCTQDARTLSTHVLRPSGDVILHTAMRISGNSDSKSGGDGGGIGLPSSTVSSSTSVMCVCMYIHVGYAYIYLIVWDISEQKRMYICMHVCTCKSAFYVFKHVWMCYVYMHLIAL